MGILRKFNVGSVHCARTRILKGNGQQRSLTECLHRVFGVVPVGVIYRSDVLQLGLNVDEDLIV